LAGAATQSNRVPLDRDQWPNLFREDSGINLKGMKSELAIGKERKGFELRLVNLKIILIMLIAISAGPSGLKAQIPWVNGESRDSDLQVMLVTFGVGDDIPSYWGHTALCVQDTAKKVSRIYNFGLYSFDQGFLLRFVSGRMIFSAGSSSLSFYLNFYSGINRDIRLATLNLPPEKRMWLARELERFILPENRDYLYDHYRENCSTRLRDLIDQAVDGQFKQAMSSPASMTLRDHTRRYTGRDPLLEILLVFMMNNSIDQPISIWDEMFLPDELERNVMSLEYGDSTSAKHKLVEEYSLYYQSGRDPVPDKVLLHWPYFLSAGLGLGLMALFLGWINSLRPSNWAGTGFGVYNFLIGLVFGIPGLLLTLTSAFTHHAVTFHNINLLLANPLTLLFIPGGILIARHKVRWYKATTWLWYIHLAGLVIAILLKLLPGFNQENGLVLSLIAPLWAGMSAASFFFFKDETD